MKNEDFAEGIYWILDAIRYKLGGGYDFSCGIDYRNDVFETFNFWQHCECSCSYQQWQWDMEEQVNERMMEYLGHPAFPDLKQWDSEWVRLYRMEWGNVTQGKEREHDGDCLGKEYGFRHFESGLEVEWYKRVGRSTKSNKGMKTLEWYSTVVECLESVRDAH